VKPKGKRHNTIPVQLGGQFSAGDPSTLPDGFVSVLRNYMIRPNRFEGRAPFVYDALDAVSGFAIWQDMTNELQKTVATNGFDNKLYTKNANGIGYGTGLAGLTASIRLTGYTNILGKLYLAFDNGAGVPTAMAVYDGTNLSMTPFNSTISARAVTSFVDRLFLTGARVTVTPQFALGGNAYNLTDTLRWQVTNITRANVAASGGTVCRFYLTSTTASSFYYQRAGIADLPNLGIVNVAASATPQNVTWRSALRCLSAAYRMPITLEILYFAPWYHGTFAGTAWAVGDLVWDGADPGHIFRCTVAGTGGLVAPAWNTTVGATTVDVGATWTCEGSNVLASRETTLSTATESSDPDTFYLTGAVPARTNAASATIRCKFFNTASPTITLAPVDVSFKDGLADGNPAKANWGQQVTLGDFAYPFYNQETASSGTVNIDAEIWSEISNPKQILARNTYPLTEIAGLSTASIISNGRKVVFKRSGMWIFKGNADPFEPILPESPALSVGCIGPLALDVSRDNDLYWIGENHVYKMKIGADSGPTMIDSPGMFEEIFARGSNWVESQPMYNAPLLAIDHANKDVWIYTQRGKIHVYSIQSGLWSYLDTNPTGTSAEVRAMIFDPTSNRMLVSFGDAATTRFDETSDVGDMIVTGGGTTWNIANDIVPKPFELFAARYEATLLEVGLFHLATVQNGSLSISYSYDRGVTYTTPSGYPVTSWIGNPRIRLPVTATGESVTVKISRTGAGGRRNWTISKADALLRVHRGESTKVNAT